MEYLLYALVCCSKHRVASSKHEVAIRSLQLQILLPKRSITSLQLTEVPVTVAGPPRTEMITVVRVL